MRVLFSITLPAGCPIRNIHFATACWVESPGNSKIRNWFYKNERDKQIDKQAEVELDFKKPTDDDKDEDDIDFLNPDTSPEKTINVANSKKAFSKWFNKRFTKKANLTTTPLMEAYVKTITNLNKYY